MAKYLLFLLACCCSLATAFKVTRYSQTPEKTVLRTGERMQLLCKSDNAWERCNWIHRPPGEKKEDKYCKMEWKQATKSVQFTDCPLKSKVRQIGNYKKNECGIEVTRLQKGDAGTWECHMEEYKWGDWSSGPSHAHVFTPLTVRSYREPEHVPETTPQPELVPEPEHVPEVVEESEEDPEEEVLEPEHEDEGDNPEYEDDDEKFELPEGGGDNVTYVDDSASEGNYTAELPVHWHSNEDALEEEGGSLGPIIGGVVTVVALVAVLGVASLFWAKKRRSMATVTMSKLKECDDRSQATAFIEEAEYHASVPGPEFSGPVEEC